MSNPNLNGIQVSYLLLMLRSKQDDLPHDDDYNSEYDIIQLMIDKLSASRGA